MKRQRMSKLCQLALAREGKKRGSEETREEENREGREGSEETREEEKGEGRERWRGVKVAEEEEEKGEGREGGRGVKVAEEEGEGDISSIEGVEALLNIKRGGVR